MRSLRGRSDRNQWRLMVRCWRGHKPTSSGELIEAVPRAGTQAPPVDRRGQQPEDDAEVFGASQYTKARAVREHYQARLAKIDYEERIAKLVSGEEVQVAAFNKFRQFRDAMIILPDRLAAMLAAETVETTVHALLTNEIRKALNDFADESNG